MDGATDTDQAEAARTASSPVYPAPPATGDAALDEALADLAQAQTKPFGERVDSGERFHRLLQGRLDDLGQA